MQRSAHIIIVTNIWCMCVLFTACMHIVLHSLSGTKFPDKINPPTCVYCCRLHDTHSLFSLRNIASASIYLRTFFQSISPHFARYILVFLSLFFMLSHWRWPIPFWSRPCSLHILSTSITSPQYIYMPACVSLVIPPLLKPSVFCAVYNQPFLAHLYLPTYLPTCGVYVSPNIIA